MKHAYCILAHNNWSQLQLLLNNLDDDRNDIYLHVDLKSLENFNKYGGVKMIHSSFYQVDSISVSWGDISICDAEISLYSAVINSHKNYDRIHLLSGLDFPLKSQNEIHDFFDCHQDVEFIDLRTDINFEKRMKYYYFFLRESRGNKLLTFIRRLSLFPQFFFVNRLKKSPLKFAFGSNWTSLTLRALKEIVSVYRKNRKLFLFTSCSDEHFQQMILFSNGSFHFSKQGNVRYIDWSQNMSSPKILINDDYPNLVKSDCLFARKFDIQEDSSILNQIICDINR